VEARHPQVVWFLGRHPCLEHNPRFCPSKVHGRKEAEDEGVAPSGVTRIHSRLKLSGLNGMGSETTILFISWDGPSTTYVEGLFAPTLARIGRPVHVLQLTYAGGERIRETEKAVTRLGVGFDAVRLRSPRSGKRAFGLGFFSARQALKRHLRRWPDKMVIVRSALPWSLLATLRLARPVVFDTDGLLADERREHGASLVSFGALRSLEMTGCLKSKLVLTRTERARGVLARRYPFLSPDQIMVVPNGRDERVFRPPKADEKQAVRRQLGLHSDRMTIGFVGSVGPQYCMQESRALIERVARRRPVQILVLTGAIQEAEQLFGTLKDVRVMRAPFADVPRLLRAMDWGLALRRARPSQCAVSPLKIAEFLLSGLGVVASPGIGDLDRQLRGVEGVVFARPESTSDLDQAADKMVDFETQGSTLSRRLAGEEHFSIGASARGYSFAVAEAIRR